MEFLTLFRKALLDPTDTASLRISPQKTITPALTRQGQKPKPPIPDAFFKAAKK